MSLMPRLTSEQLTTIRQHTDWRQLFTALQIEKDSKKSRDHDWWGKSPFKPDERTASFHMNDRGWYCHSTGQGGGPIELVQRVHPEMNCYDAGRWLVEHGISRIVEDVRGEVEASTAQVVPAGSGDPEKAEQENPPIRQDLRGQLTPHHLEFGRRGIPPEVLEELGAGYLRRPPRKGNRPDPMNRRLVFQIRGLRESASGYMEPVILGHIGRATSKEQAKQDGKWWTYAGFKKSLELYNIDHAILDDEAVAQAKDTDHVLVVEGPFDVAKLYAAGIRNVVATFGADLSPAQYRLLDLIDELIGVKRFLFFYDRDNAGTRGAKRASDAVCAASRDLEADIFNWHQTWKSSQRSEVMIPPSIGDPCDFSIAQLQWLRREGWI